MQVKKSKQHSNLRIIKNVFISEEFQYLVIKKKSEKSENAGAHDILLNISAAFSFYVK